ncbi:MAG: farnesyl diphosphate synthase [Pseudomonadota bacterium]
MDFRSYLAERSQLVDQALEEALPRETGPAARLFEAMAYSLFAGGKRLRPILCLAGAEIVGGRPEAGLPAAVAVELIHTYSLIHDDLPGMDDDDYRRGRPANHKVYGEGLAILAGDGLLTLAFEYLIRVGKNGLVPTDLCFQVMGILARAAGPWGMVGGQAVDLESEGKIVDLDAVRFIHHQKTAALISAALASGAILGRGTSRQIDALSSFGRLLGLGFQIVDDVLDIEGDPRAMGKPVGSDQGRGKATYPKVVGLDQAKDDANRIMTEARAALDIFGPEAEPLRSLSDFVVQRKS